jgi:hypothetical protein
VQLQQAEGELEVCLKACDNTGVDASSALLAAYECFKNILSKLEVKAQKTREAAVAAAEEEAAGPPQGEEDMVNIGDQQVKPSVTTAATAAAAAERLELWYQHLRVFVRRFRVESADVAKQLQELMKYSGGEGEELYSASGRMIHELTVSLLLN